MKRRADRWKRTKAGTPVRYARTCFLGCGGLHEAGGAATLSGSDGEATTRASRWRRPSSSGVVVHGVGVLGSTAAEMSARTALIALCTSGRQGCTCALQRIASQGVERALNELFARTMHLRVPVHCPKVSLVTNARPMKGLTRSILARTRPIVALEFVVRAGIIY